MWVREVAESKERAANNTTSEFLHGKPSPNAKMGLEVVSPEFMLMTGGVGGLANKATTALGKIGQTALYGGTQGAIANAANISGSKQNLEGLATDVLGGALIGGGLKGIGLGVQNIPGIGKDAPELGFHALNKNHWALHPKKLNVTNRELQILYEEAALNRLLPIINKTKLVNPIKKIAEPIMRSNSTASRSINEIDQVLKKTVPQNNTELKILKKDYRGNFDGSSDRDLINLYLYGDETGFVKAGDDIEKIDFGLRYKKLYPKAKTYIMNSSKKHGETINHSQTPNEEVNFDTTIIPYNKPTGIVGGSNIIKPIDDISGHQILIKKGMKGEPDKLISQDLWKFNPADYSKRWGNYGDMQGTKFDILNTEKQAGIIDKLGKPFYLVQNNPINITRTTLPKN